MEKEQRKKTGDVPQKEQEKEKLSNPSSDIPSSRRERKSLNLVAGFDESSVDVDADGIYEEVELDDMEFDEIDRTWYYPCPCGDEFFITEEELMDGEEIAYCPSCSLKIRVLYDPEEFMRSSSEEETDEEE